ncbi:hypothetical protein [Halolamina salina]|uniref:DUF7998 domain-containing protein n=1 Tax=Halolamina salina TaxID=1220023 RepID=A0ABD6B504_9EURY
MSGLSPFGGGNDDATFDEEGEFVPEHLPEPGGFLDGHNVLLADEHVAVHEIAHELFEERGVYDMTFGYNLARLNFDTRHPEAGFRYAEEADDPAVLRAEFTPTTAFCPQTHTLTVGAFRAWNGVDDRHDYEIVRIRAAPMHQESDAVNEQLRSLEEEYRETGTVPEEDDDDAPATDSPDVQF